MGLRKHSSNDPDGQVGLNDLSHGAWNSMHSAQNSPSSQAAASQPESASDLNYTLRSDVAYDEVPNPWIQELAYRPAIREIPLSSQTSEADNQRLHQHGQYEGGTQILDSSHEMPEKEHDATAIFDSNCEPFMGSSVEDGGRHSTSPGQFRSNNPFLRARQNSSSQPKCSTSSPDPFDFPQSSSLDGHQDRNFAAHPHNLHGLDDELSQVSSQISYEHNHYDLSVKNDPRDTDNASSFLEKGKEPVVSRSPSTAIQPSNPYHQSDKTDFITQNPNRKGFSLQPAPSSQSSGSPNLISFQEETKPSEIAQTNVPPFSEKPVNLFDDDPKNLSNNSLSKPDELDSSVSNPTTHAVASDSFQPSLSKLNQHGHPASMLQEKLSETYDIRQVNWTDGTTSLRKSPVLVQSENGPCPLLALVNGLVLRSRADSPSPITKALQSREKISLGLLMQALFDELTSYIDGADQLPDIEALSSFLVMLHTGMNVNPQLVLTNYTSDSPGTFLETNDTIFYSSFKLPLVHGWLAEPSSAAYAALNRVAQNHEDIQLLHFRKEELEDHIFRGESLTTDEEQLIEDINTIQHFVDVENATQLSAFGLEHLERCLKPGSISILFRNDHFSTLFKHPLSNQLFTLVTDAGYANHAEIVWESLVDVNGSNASFFSGDFRPVGNFAPPAASSQNLIQDGPATSSESTHRNNPERNTGISANNTEQTDADYAYALALQFQDEEEQRRTNSPNQAQTQTSRLPSTPRPSSQSQGVTHRHSNSGSNLGHRQSTSSTGRRAPQQTQEVRSLVPPPRTPVVNPGADAPPPTYEQAANSPVYTPSPDQSQYDGSHGSNPSIVGPRSSSYGFNNNLGPNRGPVYNGNRRSHTSNPSLPPRPRDRDRNKDCTVM
ncbi:hypothetical protein EMCG_08750 [[Emmonsia] crescens]|uniref:MINDY deubiquitinase domain-containing protein n=1 Tax=[Emmonsia] crescens TaxID=73230 RepID=A0A0G2JAB0_9EURO|nr:hypothetical protein EMCG_08750 [Emmonsia crescens UAMH 3008]